MKNIKEMKTICHGIHDEQEFQGCGVSFTEYTECVTGIGNNAYEAKEDALDQLAEMGYNVDNIANEEDNTFCLIGDDGDGLHMYVSLLIKGDL